MDNRFDKIDSKLDNIQSDLTDIKITNAQQAEQIKIITASVVHHIKRTDDLQTLVELLQRNASAINVGIKIILGVGSFILALDQLGILRRLF